MTLSWYSLIPFWNCILNLSCTKLLETVKFSNTRKAKDGFNYHLYSCSLKIYNDNVSLIRVIKFCKDNWEYILFLREHLLRAKTLSEPLLASLSFNIIHEPRRTKIVCRRWFVKDNGKKRDNKRKDLTFWNKISYI